MAGKKKKNATAVNKIKAEIKKIKKDPVSWVTNVVVVPVVYFKKACFWTGFVMIIGFFIALASVIGFLNSLPDIDEMAFDDLKGLGRKYVLNKLEVKSKIYKWVSIKDVSRDYLYSIVMSEDAEYFEHNGINYDSIVNSLAVNIKKKRFAVGGSTISQQVVKNLFLTNTKTLTRKARELLITKDLEKRFSKNEILELYLNIVEIGPDIYGVNAASHTYFKKRPNKVNAAEGGFVALMLPSPRRNHYSIFENRNISRMNKRKLNRILNGMLYNSYISPAQYRKYTRFRYFKGARRGLAGK